MKAGVEYDPFPGDSDRMPAAPKGWRLPGVKLAAPQPAQQEQQVMRLTGPPIYSRSPMAVRQFARTPAAQIFSRH